MCDRPKLATLPELAELLDMRPGTVYDLARRRHWPTYRVGRSVRVDVDEILALLRDKGEA